jgi:hypothetical protein
VNRLALAGLLALSIAACTDSDLDSTLTIENDSSFTFVEINLSPTDQISWGPDLLGADVLEPGDVLETSGIACGTYDIRVIDETAGECILDTVDLCLDEAVWRIDDAELISCGF